MRNYIMKKQNRNIDVLNTGYLDIFGHYVLHYHHFMFNFTNNIYFICGCASCVVIFDLNIYKS